MRYRNQSQGAANVVVIGVEPEGMGLIRECLGTEAVLPTQSTSYAEAMQVAHKIRPNVIIMGFDIDFSAAIELGSQLINDLPGVHLVAISEQTDPERIRAAMRAGYREYVILPADAPLLRQAVHDAAYGATQSEDLGEVIAVVGTKGGVGSTLLTVNLGAELSSLFSVCVVDLDFSMGDVSSFLDLKPNNSIKDILQNLHRLDARMLRGSVAVHPPSGMHVLPQPADLPIVEEIRSDDIVRILGATAESYQYVLVDCGSHIDAATMTAVEVADRILLICPPDVAGVKNAWRRLQMLQQMGIEKDTVRLIINNWEKNAQVNDTDIVRNLKTPIAARIHRDNSCQEAVTFGKLIRDVRKTQAAEDIAATASLITEGLDEVDTPPSKSPFGWLFR